MDVTSAGSSSSLNSSHKQSQTAKRKFFQWAVKWFYANMSEDSQEKPDAPVLASLLQSIGFQLREFGKNQESWKDDKQELKNETIRVTIECGTSGMKACLEMDDIKCQCPNSELAEDASFWSVSGTGPAARVQESTTKIEDSGSNILPPLSKGTKKVLSDVIYRLISLVNDKSIDINLNSASHSNLNLSRIGSSRDILEMPINESIKNDSISMFRSHTQPEIVLSGTRGDVHRHKSTRHSLVKERIFGVPGLVPKFFGETIDLDEESLDGDQPRPSPPKIASSPVVLTQLCSSLSQISLQSEEEAGNLTENVVRAHRYLEKAVEILLGRKSPISHNSSTHERGTLLKPREGVLNVTGSGSRKKSMSSASLRSSPTSRPISRQGSSCSMPGRDLSTSVTSRPPLSLPKPNPSMTRRSVGSALTNLPSSQVTAKRINNNNIIIPPSNAGASKIPGRRKSFGAFSNQPLKLAVAKARTAANEAKNTRAISPTNLTNSSGIQKPGSSHNQSVNAASAVQPIIKVPPMINPSGTIKQPNTRKSLATPKFGFNKKP